MVQRSAGASMRKGAGTGVRGYRSGRWVGEAPAMAKWLGEDGCGGVGRLVGVGGEEGAK